MALVHLSDEKKLPALTFVLGGAASGKSKTAEMLIENSGLNQIYIATSRIWDAETKTKIDAHKARRDARWHTIDAHIDLPGALEGLGAEDAVLIDCATMWLTNLIMDQADIPAMQKGLLSAVKASTARIVIVSNEVGQGIVPENALARRFRDVQGRFNMAMAAEADVVLHVVAGLPNLLKGQLA